MHLYNLERRKHTLSLFVLVKTIEFIIYWLSLFLRRSFFAKLWLRNWNFWFYGNHCMRKELKTHFLEALLTIMLDDLLQSKLLLYIRVITFSTGESVDNSFKIGQLHILIGDLCWIGQVLFVHNVIPEHYFNVSTAFRAGTAKSK